LPNDIFAEMEEDALEAPTLASDNEIKSLSALLQQQLDMEEEIQQLETVVKQRKHEYQKLTTETIPQHAQAINCTLHRLQDGSTFELKPFVSAHISKAKKDEAFTWLKQNGHSDIIKNQVKLDFGMQDLDKAEECLKTLTEAGYSPSAESSVHSGTLKKWVREQVEAGEPIPLELFGAYLGQVSTITKG